MLALVPSCDQELDIDDAELADGEAAEADEVEGDGAAQTPPTHDGDLALPTRGVGGVTDPVKSCYWRKASNETGTGAIVTCGSGYQILSGGCYNTTSGPSIYKNHPWESGSIGNLPEDLEWATDLDGSNGWSCQKDSSSGTIITVGLCCKST